MCVCIYVFVNQRGRQKAREGQGRWRQMQKGRETEGGRENERQREKSNLQEHNKKLYLWQKRTHKGICLAVCTSRILWKFIKLEPFKRRQRVVNYTTGEEKRKGEGTRVREEGGEKWRKKKASFSASVSQKFFYFSHALSNLPTEFCSPSWCG